MTSSRLAGSCAASCSTMSRTRTSEPEPTGPTARDWNMAAPSSPFIRFQPETLTRRGLTRNPLLRSLAARLTSEGEVEDSDGTNQATPQQRSRRLLGQPVQFGSRGRGAFGFLRKDDRRLKRGGFHPET